MSELITLSKARKDISSEITGLRRLINRPSESVPIHLAANRVLSGSVVSEINVPRDDNSAMDGIALSSGDFVGGEIVDVSMYLSAGKTTEGEKLKPGTVARIFTGGVIPDGADTVLAQEACEFLGEDKVRLPEKFEFGGNIRSAGQDIKKNAEVFKMGRALNSQDIALLAAMGKQSVSCFTRLKVGLLSTGDELIEPGEFYSEGKVYNSNRYLLQVMLESMGCEVKFYHLVDDDLGKITAAIESLAQENDCIISTGGASVGDSDFIKPALQSLGDMALWRIAIKPGKPFLFGNVGEKPFFGLPGNPVAVFVTFLILVKPALLEFMGQDREQVEPKAFKVRSNFSFKANAKRQEFCRVKICYERGEPYLDLYENQSSGVLSSVCFSDGLASVPIEIDVRPGDYLDFYPFFSL